jgi:ABC-type spermidine/putrescine transport system permease subunit I
MTRFSTLSDRLRPLLAAAPAAVLLALFGLGPMLLLLRVSLFADAGGRVFYLPDTWTLENYPNLGGDPYFRDVLVFTICFGAAVALLTMLIAYPLSLFIHSLPPRAKSAALAAVVLPKLASVLVVIYGLEYLLSNAGPINRVLLALGMFREPVPMLHNLAGAMIGETYLILPYAVLVLVGGLDRIDPSLAAAARGLGATSWQAFRRVTLPLSLPAIFLAGQISLIWALSAFLGPMLLGGPEQTTLAVEVQRQALERNDWPKGAVVAVAMIATLAVCLTLYALPAIVLRRKEGGA